MRTGTAESDLRGAIFSVRLADLVARELMLAGTGFQFEKSGAGADAASAPESAAAKLAEPLWERIVFDPFLPDQIDISVAETCHEVVRLMVLAGESSKATQSQRLRYRLNSAVAFLLMHSVQRAAEEATIVLDVDGAHPRALLLKARIHYYWGDLRATRDAAMAVRGSDTQAVAILAESCVAGGETAQAQSLYARLLETGEGRPDFIKARLLRIADVSGDSASAERLVAELQGAVESSLIAGLSIAEYWFNHGAPARAADFLLELEGSASTQANAKLWYAWQLGRMQFLTESYLKACDWYCKVAPDELDSLAHREYVHALYRAGLIPGAHKRARAIRGKNGRVIHGITEIEADGLAQAGKFSDARALITELISDRPQSNHLLLSLARLYAVTGDFIQAKQCVQRIDLTGLPQELRPELEALNSELARY